MSIISRLAKVFSIRPQRLRSYLYYVFPFLFMSLYFIVDPYNNILPKFDVGASSVVFILDILKVFTYLAIFACARKLILDYQEADLKSNMSKASSTPSGAGYNAISISLMSIAIAIVIAYAIQK